MASKNFTKDKAIRGATLNYLSVCSGIEAATVAWHDFGWKPVGFSEIEKFPSQVLAHHYPQVTNFGDMTKYKEWKLDDTIGLLVGGTPCQSFSVAGLRKGLEDPRGNLALTYVGILDKFRPKWCIWENVPGVLSSGGGRDFGAFLGALGELGYGWAYRVLDAQNFGVAQRRRRVFVVGCLGNWESAAKVLFESESLSGNIKKSRSKGKDIANCLARSPASYSSYNPARSEGNAVVVNKTVGTLLARDCKGLGSFDHDKMIVQAYSIREDAKANNFSATPLNVTPALQALRPSVQSHHAQTFIAQGFDAYNSSVTGNISKTLDTGSDYHHVPNVYSQKMAVRRLTPTECERLQGFPDSYTNIKENCPDGPRYKALGNSMAVPVMRWIGERINKFEQQL